MTLPIQTKLFSNERISGKYQVNWTLCLDITSSCCQGRAVGYRAPINLNVISQVWEYHKISIDNSPGIEISFSHICWWMGPWMLGSFISCKALGCISFCWHEWCDFPVSRALIRSFMSNNIRGFHISQLCSARRFFTEAQPEISLCLLWAFKSQRTDSLD